MFFLESSTNFDSLSLASLSRSRLGGAAAAAFCSLPAAAGESALTLLLPQKQQRQHIRRQAREKRERRVVADCRLFFRSSSSRPAFSLPLSRCSLSYFLPSPRRQLDEMPRKTERREREREKSERKTHRREKAWFHSSELSEFLRRSSPSSRFSFFLLLQPRPRRERKEPPVSSANATRWPPPTTSSSRTTTPAAPASSTRPARPASRRPRSTRRASHQPSHPFVHEGRALVPRDHRAFAQAPEGLEGRGSQGPGGSGASSLSAAAAAAAAARRAALPKRGDTVFQAATFRKGACENCGAMTHKVRDCLERPRARKAKLTGKHIAADEAVVLPIGLGRRAASSPSSFAPVAAALTPSSTSAHLVGVSSRRTFDGKHDRWEGYDPTEHDRVVELFEKVEKAKGRGQARCGARAAVSEEGEQGHEGERRSCGGRFLRLRLRLRLRLLER